MRSSDDPKMTCKKNKKISMRRQKSMRAGTGNYFLFLCGLIGDVMDEGFIFWTMVLTRQKISSMTHDELIEYAVKINENIHSNIHTKL